MTNHWKTLSIILAILLVIVIAYHIYTKPENVELARPQAEETQITLANQVIEGKDSLIERYKDSLQQSRNKITVITKTAYREQETIITEPLTESRVGRVKTYLADFYDNKVHEVGIDPSPEIKLPDISLTTKEFTGAELLVSDYKIIKSVNIELEKQTNLLNQSLDLKASIINEKDKIISLKEVQIRRLESTPVPVVKQRSWLVDAGIIAGSVAIGFTIGVIYQNSK